MRGHYLLISFNHSFVQQMGLPVFCVPGTRDTEAKSKQSPCSGGELMLWCGDTEDRSLPTSGGGKYRTENRAARESLGGGEGFFT